MMIAMSSRKVLGFCAALAILAGGSAVLSEVNHESGSTSLIGTMLSRFVVVMAFGTFGMYAAQESNLRGSILLTSDETGNTFRELVNYGVLPGVVLGLINYLFFFTYRYSSFVVPRIREMDDLYDSFIVSLDTGIVEEVLYRLFIMSCLLFLFQHLYRKIKPIQPVLVSILPRAMALVLTSLLFAMAHNIYGFTAAFVGGMFLGLIFFKGGIESAVAAHFVANFFFFSVSYLS
tara:strand:- start:202 stop:900 length:699 start_codon:yes stop_codon:yes gene_type:complete